VVLQHWQSDDGQTWTRQMDIGTYVAPELGVGINHPAIGNPPGELSFEVDRSLAYGRSTERLIKNSQVRPRRVQEILQLDLVCLQHFAQNRGLKRLTAVYREIRGWLRGCLRVGDVPFPAGNFHRILVPDLAGPPFQTEPRA
jgi:hypothetical protein